VHLLERFGPVVGGLLERRLAADSRTTPGFVEAEMRRDHLIRDSSLGTSILGS